MRKEHFYLLWHMGEFKTQTQTPKNSIEKYTKPKLAHGRRMV